MRMTYLIDLEMLSLFLEMESQKIKIILNHSGIEGEEKAQITKALQKRSHPLIGLGQWIKSPAIDNEEMRAPLWMILIGCVLQLALESLWMRMRIFLIVQEMSGPFLVMANPKTLTLLRQHGTVLQEEEYLVCQTKRMYMIDQVMSAQFLVMESRILRNTLKWIGSVQKISLGFQTKNLLRLTALEL